MNESFGDTLRRIRKEKNLSQQQLADMLFVERSSVASWESERRTPDAVLLLRIAECLDTDVNILLETLDNTAAKPNIIIVDDESIILKGEISLITQLFPNASVTGFTSPKEALEYARSNKIHLALLDIELGNVSGLELCRELLNITPRTNVIYLTAYPDYALDAWRTDAAGFAVKPLSAERLLEQLKRLKYPIRGLKYQ